MTGIEALLVCRVIAVMLDLKGQVVLQALQVQLVQFLDRVVLVGRVVQDCREIRVPAAR
jgi:hypothetical protein